MQIISLAVIGQNKDHRDCHVTLMCFCLLVVCFLILINLITTSARSVHEYSKLGTNGGTNCAGKYTVVTL